MGIRVYYAGFVLSCMKAMLAVIVLFFCLGCGDNLPPPSPTPTGVPTGTSTPPSLPGEVDLSLLFVGNSLSYSNSMPDMIEEIGYVHEIKIKTTCLCKPNYALLDHWDESELKNLIETGNYDYVILQQGPSSLEYGAMVLLDYGQLIKDLAQEHGAITSFYQVWPSVARYFSFSDVINNYARAARATDSELFEVGRVWKAYVDGTEDNSVYASDLFHPSRKGSFLAAWVIFHSIYPEEHYDYNVAYEKNIDENSLNTISDIFKSL